MDDNLNNINNKKGPKAASLGALPAVGAALLLQRAFKDSSVAKNAKLAKNAYEVYLDIVDPSGAEARRLKKLNEDLNKNSLIKNLLDPNYRLQSLKQKQREKTTSEKILEMEMIAAARSAIREQNKIAREAEKERKRKEIQEKQILEESKRIRDSLARSAMKYHEKEEKALNNTISEQTKILNKAKADFAALTSKIEYEIMKEVEKEVKNVEINETKKKENSINIKDETLKRLKKETEKAEKSKAAYDELQAKIQKEIDRRVEEEINKGISSEEAYAAFQKKIEEDASKIFDKELKKEQLSIEERNKKKAELEKEIESELEKLKRKFIKSLTDQENEKEKLEKAKNKSIVENNSNLLKALENSKNSARKAIETTENIKKNIEKIAEDSKKTLKTTKEVISNPTDKEAWKNFANSLFNKQSKDNFSEEFFKRAGLSGNTEIEVKEKTSEAVVDKLVKATVMRLPDILNKGTQIRVGEDEAYDLDTIHKSMKTAGVKKIKKLPKTPEQIKNEKELKELLKKEIEEAATTLALESMKNRSIDESSLPGLYVPKSIDDIMKELMKKRGTKEIYEPKNTETIMKEVSEKFGSKEIYIAKTYDTILKEVMSEKGTVEDYTPRSLEEIKAKIEAKFEDKFYEIIANESSASKNLEVVNKKTVGEIQAGLWGTQANKEEIKQTDYLGKILDTLNVQKTFMKEMFSDKFTKIEASLESGDPTSDTVGFNLKASNDIINNKIKNDESGISEEISAALGAALGAGGTAGVIALMRKLPLLGGLLSKTKSLASSVISAGAASGGLLSSTVTAAAPGLVAAEIAGSGPSDMIDWLLTPRNQTFDPELGRFREETGNEAYYRNLKNERAQQSYNNKIMFNKIKKFFGFGEPTKESVDEIKSQIAEKQEFVDNIRKYASTPGEADMLAKPVEEEIEVLKTKLSSMTGSSINKLSFPEKSDMLQGFNLPTSFPIIPSGRFTTSTNNKGLQAFDKTMKNIGKPSVSAPPVIVRHGDVHHHKPTTVIQSGGGSSQPVRPDNVKRPQGFDYFFNSGGRFDYIP